MTMRCEICRNDARFAVCGECVRAVIAFLRLRAGMVAPPLPPSNETEALDRYADEHADDPATNPANN